jgi:phosphoheptose isomerase
MMEEFIENHMDALIEAITYQDNTLFDNVNLATATFSASLVDNKILCLSDVSCHPFAQYFCQSINSNYAQKTNNLKALCLDSHAHSFDISNKSVDSNLLQFKMQAASGDSLFVLINDLKSFENLRQIIEIAHDKDISVIFMGNAKQLDQLPPNLLDESLDIQLFIKDGRQGIFSEITISILNFIINRLNAEDIVSSTISE